MKLLTTLTLLLSLTTHATHTLTYYVYFETEYVQGPWSRLDVLEETDYMYLAPRVYEDLFGSEYVDMVNRMLGRLKERKPRTYDWDYDLSIQGDTVVVIKPKGPIKRLKTVKNEVVATLMLNNFKAVVFDFGDKRETLTLKDLTLPYLDLVSGQPARAEPIVEPVVVEPAVVDTLQTPPEADSIPQIEEAPIAEDEEKEESNPLTIWLIISGALNVSLVGALIWKRK